MLQSLMQKTRAFVREQRWSKVVAARLLRGCPTRPPDLITDFSTGPVLVIAPHMDDETIGCGGTIIKHRTAGTAVTVLFMTDGSRGNKELRRDERLIPGRKAEAQRAMQHLGGPDVLFLDLPERLVQHDRATVQLLEERLKEIRPAIVYVPSVFDGHPDHIVTCRAASEAMLNTMQGEGPTVREYEVWSALTPNRLVDITAEIETKINAMREFKSQLLDMDYCHITRGMSMYRSLFHLHGHGNAEAFFECSVRGHADLIRQVKA